MSDRLHSSDLSDGTRLQSRKSGGRKAMQMTPNYKAPRKRTTAATPSKRTAVTPSKRTAVTPSKAVVTPTKAVVTPTKAVVTPAKAVVTPAKAVVTPQLVVIPDDDGDDTDYEEEDEEEEEEIDVPVFTPPTKSEVKTESPSVPLPDPDATDSEEDTSEPLAVKNAKKKEAEKEAAAKAAESAAKSEKEAAAKAAKDAKKAAEKAFKAAIAQRKKDEAKFNAELNELDVSTKRIDGRCPVDSINGRTWMPLETHLRDSNMVWEGKDGTGYASNVLLPNKVDGKYPPIKNWTFYGEPVGGWLNQFSLLDTPGDHACMFHAIARVLSESSEKRYTQRDIRAHLVDRFNWVEEKDAVQKAEKLENWKVFLRYYAQIPLFIEQNKKSMPNPDVEKNPELQKIRKWATAETYSETEFRECARFLGKSTTWGDTNMIRWILAGEPYTRLSMRFVVMSIQPEPPQLLESADLSDDDVEPRAKPKGRLWSLHRLPSAIDAGYPVFREDGNLNHLRYCVLLNTNNTHWQPLGSSVDAAAPADTASENPADDAMWYKSLHKHSDGQYELPADVRAAIRQRMDTTHIRVLHKASDLNARMHPRVWRALFDLPLIPPPAVDASSAPPFMDPPFSSTVDHGIKWSKVARHQFDKMMTDFDVSKPELATFALDLRRLAISNEIVASNQLPSLSSMLSIVTNEKDDILRERIAILVTATNAPILRAPLSEPSVWVDEKAVAAIGSDTAVREWCTAIRSQIRSGNLRMSSTVAMEMLVNNLRQSSVTVHASSRLKTIYGIHKSSIHKRGGSQTTTTKRSARLLGEPLRDDKRLGGHVGLGKPDKEEKYPPRLAPEVVLGAVAHVAAGPAYQYSSVENMITINTQTTAFVVIRGKEEGKGGTLWQPAELFVPDKFSNVPLNDRKYYVFIVTAKNSCHLLAVPNPSAVRLVFSVSTLPAFLQRTVLTSRERFLLDFYQA